MKSFFLFRKYLMTNPKRAMTSSINIFFKLLGGADTTFATVHLPKGLIKYLGKVE